MKDKEVDEVTKMAKAIIEEYKQKCGYSTPFNYIELQNKLLSYEPERANEDLELSEYNIYFPIGCVMFENIKGFLVPETGCSRIHERDSMGPIIAVIPPDALIVKSN